MHSTELEKVTGLTRYDLSRQFRKVLGTSPYRYSVNRRLDAARQLIQQNKPIVEVAFETGFSDQAHFSRLFKSACGITPGRYASIGK
ncbi:helix-turn-helix domain-containing protein [Moritella yayanosii]|uniref:helix-turn-helix domain-containing protein n=1 Tax=Moritella yayanosii TaxID=69539 RepID=UPI0022B26CE7|nr:helix-turn-helix transcriptional regulator [Moritella yayanosii]